MIQSETINNDLIWHYSDARLRIEQVETGKVYDDAVDAIPCVYTYRETNEPIGGEDEDAAEEDYLSALASLGVSE